MPYTVADYCSPNQYCSEDEKIIADLAPQLSEILRKEIDEGNKILSVAAGWPKKDSIFVQLAYSFRRKYKIDGLEYRDVDDPHYWKSEYSTQSPVHILACAFGNSG